MSRDKIKHIIAGRTISDGLTEIGIKGVRLFRATEATPCAPAVYEPCVVAIVSGAKEAFLDGRRYVYDDSQYLCCPISLPIKAGTPAASRDDPLYGVMISLDRRAMTGIAMEMEAPEASCPRPAARSGSRGSGLRGGMTPSPMPCCGSCSSRTARRIWRFSAKGGCGRSTMPS